MTQVMPPSEGPVATTPDGLAQAMRRARSDEAERSGARAELRAARLGRLEMLQDALQPLLAQIPAEVDMFDVALVPSSDPRLFIDMIGFVEMGRDARYYILQQDTRHGRIRILETESLDTMVEGVTDYVARRLLERDKALAADALRRGRPDASGASGRDPLPRVGDSVDGASVRPAPLRWATIAFAFVIDLLGAIALLGILAVLGWYVWSRVHPPT